MEAIGAAASIISLLQILGSLQNAVQFLFRYHDSTSDFHRLSDQIENLTSNLDLLKIVKTWATACDSLLEERESSILESSFLAAQKDISYVRDVCLKCGKGKSTVVKRLKWAIRDGQIRTELASRLQEAQSLLTFTLQIIHMKIATLARVENQNSADGIRNELRRIWAILDQKLTTRPAETEHLEIAGSDNYLSDHAQPDRRVPTMTLWLLQDCWIKYGIQLALTTVEKTFFTSNALAIKIPFPTIIGKSTFTADLAVRSCILRPPNISCRLGIRKIIPMSSDIVKACESQDLASVKDLLLRHKFGPNDMTEDYRPLLWHAIDGGSVEIIRFLLSFGADATVLSGPANAGLLHIAFFCRQPKIARMLISNGADPENISLYGSTPLFHLFQPDQESTMTSTAELIEMITPHSLSGINTQSCRGWTPLHRAAAYGTSQDVESLVKRGANLTLKTSREQWVPIFVAVNFNNIDTFKQLVHYSPRNCFQDTDVRGWTMLHIAAALGSSELVERLVSHGADPHALSHSSSECGNDMVPENMRGRQLTPADVAKFSGVEEYRMYVYGLRDAGVDVSSNSEEVFWPAES